MPRRRKNRPRRKANAGQLMSIPRPPSFHASPLIMHRFRYQNTTAGGLNFTNAVNQANLVSAFVMATAATTTSRIIAGARLVSLELWGEPPAQGTASTTIAATQAGIDWKGGFGPDSLVLSNASGIVPAHVFTRPPKGSTASFWFDATAGTAETIFSYGLPVGGIIDMVLELSLINDDAQNSGPAGTGLTLGTIYYTNLDGTGAVNAASAQPVGVRALT